MNRMKITLSGKEFTILTEENDSYVQQLCKQLNDRVSAFMAQSKELSVAEAYMLTAFSMVDDSAKNSNDKENLRKQVIEALEEATKLRAETAELKKQNEALKREIAFLNGDSEKADLLEGQAHF